MRPFRGVVAVLAACAALAASAQPRSEPSMTLIRGARVFDGTGFAAEQGVRESRIPFTAFRSRNDGATLDLARLRALIVQLDGGPGGVVWLELGKVRFY